MDTIEVIKAIAEGSIGIAALVVLAVVVMAWTRGRSADGSTITHLADLAVNAQRGVMELSTQTATISTMVERVLVAIERGNEIDERMINALSANTAVIEHHVADTIKAQEDTQAQMEQLRGEVVQNRGDLLKAIGSVEERLRAELETVGLAFRQYGEAQDKQLMTKLGEFNLVVGSIMQELQRIRRVLEVDTHADEEPEPLDKAA